MILVTGASGSLGKRLVPLLRSSGRPLRAIVRDPEKAGHLEGVEIVHGDVRDPGVLRRAVEGVDVVVSAMSGFGAAGDVSVESVDRDANRDLAATASAAGARHMVLVSVAEASPRHPMDLMKVKFAAEQFVRSSGMDWTIIRPTMSAETWADILGRPLLRDGKTTVFGGGNQPVNFVSARDVAGVVALAVGEPSLRGLTVDVGGPENVTMNDFVARFQAETGASGTVSHFPLPVMRMMAVALRHLKQQISRQIQAGVYIDTHGLVVDGPAARQPYPSISLTSVNEVFRADYPPAVNRPMTSPSFHSGSPSR